jgi:hypothetical protein
VISKPSRFACTREGFSAAGFADGAAATGFVGGAGGVVWAEMYGSVTAVIHSHALTAAASEGSFVLFCTIIELVLELELSDIELTTQFQYPQL